MRPVKIASRASKLAMAQSNYIRETLQSICAELEVSIVEISTKGDRDKSEFLYKSDSVGFFTSEVENAILDGRADLAVHSLKDLPTACTTGLVIAATPKRESVADALVSASGVASIEELPTGATVGTSSLRRIAQLKHARSDLNCVPLRGNVETRVRKVAEGKVDAAVLACAGLNRLGLADKISGVLDPEQFLAAPGQGALAVQVRADDAELIELVCRLNDESTRIAVETERLVLAAMHGGCSIPLGVHCRVTEETVTISGMISDVEGLNLIRRTHSSPRSESNICAEKLAAELLEAGGREILDQIRAERDESNA